MTTKTLSDELRLQCCWCSPCWGCRGVMQRAADMLEVLEREREAALEAGRTSCLDVALMEEQSR